MKDHLEVYIQYACTQPVSMQPHLAHWREALDRAPVAVQAGTGGHQPLRGRGLRQAATPTSRLPQPDVPLPPHCHPLRRLDAVVTGHGYQVHVGADVLRFRKARSRSPQYRSDPTTPGVAVQLPLDRAGPTRVGRGRAGARNILNQPAFAPYNGGEISPGPAVETDAEIIDWVARDS